MLPSNDTENQTHASNSSVVPFDSLPLEPLPTNGRRTIPTHRLIGEIYKLLADYPGVAWVFIYPNLIVICVPSLVEIARGVPELCWNIHIHTHTSVFVVAMNMLTWIRLTKVASRDVITRRLPSNSNNLISSTM
jgi:hypothetical protein